MTTRSGPKGRKRSRKKPDKTRRPVTIVVWIVAAFVGFSSIIWFVLREGPSSSFGPGEGVEQTLRVLATKHGVDAGDIESDTEIRKIDGVFVRSWKIRFPDGASREEFAAEVAILGDRDDLKVFEPTTLVGGAVGLRVDHGIEAFELELSVTRGREGYSQPNKIATAKPAHATPTPRPEPPPEARGRIAILLDDGGQSLDLLGSATKLPREVGVAILPFLPHSTDTAAEMHGSGHEVWLHLPMEALGDNDPGPGALMVGMSDDELRDTVHMAINNMPHVVGINNHMGSKATANLRVMTWVMQELAAMDLAFIDSRTTVDTVAEEAARAQGVKTGRRHVFLDNERNATAIRRQLDEAVYRSRVEGEIIAIGHLTGVTIEVLADELPGLAARGADLVPPTQLLN